MAEKKYHITVTYDNRIITNFESEMLAIVGINNAATCAVTDDIFKRVELAIKVKIYLNSLLETIAQDMGGGELISQYLNGKIGEIEKAAEAKCVRIDPTQYKSPNLNEIKEQLKKSLYGEEGEQ